MAPLLAKIVAAQASAGGAEVAEWRADKWYSTAVLAGRTIHVLGNRVVVPRGATGLNEHLLRMCHDDDAHYTGAERTRWALQTQARVTWVRIDESVVEWVRSCFRCALGKPRAHKGGGSGQLRPTLTPYANHTCDKGCRSTSRGQGRLR
jgi:hypothetical protein